MCLGSGQREYNEKGASNEDTTHPHTIHLELLLRFYPRMLLQEFEYL